MPGKSRRSSKLPSLLSVFALFGLALVGLTGWQMQAARNQTTIFDAIRQNDADAVSAFLRAGTNPNEREVPPPRSVLDYIKRRFFGNIDNSSSHTPLLAALYTATMTAPNTTQINYNPHPNIAIIRALLEAGADVQTTDGVYTPPVSFAVRSGDVAVVELLLQHGAKLDGQNGISNPLIDAASMGRESMLRCLLDHGVDVNAQDFMGQNALIATVEYARQPACVRLLLARRIAVNKTDKSGRSALSYAQNPSTQLSAAQTQHLPEISVLLKKAGAK